MCSLLWNTSCLQIANHWDLIQKGGCQQVSNWSKPLDFGGTERVLLWTRRIVGVTREKVQEKHREKCYVVYILHSMTFWWTELGQPESCDTIARLL